MSPLPSPVSSSLKCLCVGNRLSCCVNYRKGPPPVKQNVSLLDRTASRTNSRSGTQEGERWQRVWCRCTLGSLSNGLSGNRETDRARRGQGVTVTVVLDAMQLFASLVSITALGLSAQA
jgi:hypothetical protein